MHRKRRQAVAGYGGFRQGWRRLWWTMTEQQPYELVRRYPESRYSSDARLKMDLLNDHLAGKEMEIGRFYQRRSQWLASVIRFRTVIDEYQTTSHTPEALMRLTESYLALGVPEEARKAAAVLGANYPGTKWYERAYKLVQKHAA